MEIAVKKAGSVENKVAIRNALYEMEVETVWFVQSKSTYIKRFRFSNCVGGSRSSGRRKRRELNFPTAK